MSVILHQQIATYDTLLVSSQLRAYGTKTSRADTHAVFMLRWRSDISYDHAGQ